MEEDGLDEDEEEPSVKGLSEMLVMRAKFKSSMTFASRGRTARACRFEFIH